MKLSLTNWKLGPGLLDYLTNEVSSVETPPDNTMQVGSKWKKCWYTLAPPSVGTKGKPVPNSEPYLLSTDDSAASAGTSS